MPIGTHHDETGRLLWEDGRLVLQRDDGGRWRLDADPMAAQHVGKRVRVQGQRTGFDELYARDVTPC